jgi:hypothetical protein
VGLRAEGFQDLFRSRREAQALLESFVLQHPRHARQELDVDARRALRSDEHEHQVHRLAVQRLEVHRRVRSSEHQRQVLDVVGERVRNRDAATDAGAHDRFALQQLAHQGAGVTNPTGAQQRLDELLEEVLFVARRQTQNDQVERRVILQEHQQLPSPQGLTAEPNWMNLRHRSRRVNQADRQWRRESVRLRGTIRARSRGAGRDSLHRSPLRGEAG